MVKEIRSRLSLVILMALICGLVYLLPHLFLTLKYGPAGYEKTLTGDEIEYAAQIARPYGNPFILEYKNYATPWETLAIYLLQPFKWILGMGGTFVVWDFLGPFLAFLTITLLLLTVTRGKLFWQLIFACLVYALFRYGFEQFVYAVLGGTYVKWYSILMRHTPARLIHPAVSTPVLFLNLYLVVKAYFYEEGDRAKIGRYILLGILGGLLFYMRFFDAFLYLVFMGIIFIYFIFKQDKKKIMKALTHIIILFLCISVKAYSMWSFKVKNPDFFASPIVESGRRVGFQSIILFAAVLFASIIAFYSVSFIHKKIKGSAILDKETFLKLTGFILLLIFIGALGDNIQVVTGFNVESWHWYSTIMFPMITLLFSFFIAMAVSPFLKPGFYISLVVLSGILLNCVFFFNYSNTYASDPLQHNAYAWLRKNTDKDAVIGTNYYPSMVVFYTLRPTFIPYLPYSPGATNEEFFDRYFLFQGLLGNKLDKLKKELDYTNKVTYPENYERNLFRFDDPQENTEKARLVQLTCKNMDSDRMQRLIANIVKGYSQYSTEDFLKQS